MQHKLLAGLLSVLLLSFLLSGCAHLEELTDLKDSPNISPVKKQISLQKLPIDEQEEGTLAVSAENLFFLLFPQQKNQLTAISAETGELVGCYDLLLRDPDSAVLLKSYGDCVVTLTDMQALRINADGKVEQEVLLPEELPVFCDTDRALRYFLSEDGVDIKRYDFVEEEWETLAAGNLDTTPQLIYTSPRYICDDQEVLLFFNVGSERFSPGQLHLETMELRELNLSFDLTSSYNLQNDCLLISDGLQVQLNQLSDGVYSPEDSVDEEEWVRFVGYYDLKRNLFMALPVEQTGFGVQNWCVNQETLFFFRDAPEGLELCRCDMETETVDFSGRILDASNLGALAVTDSGKILVSCYDFQEISGSRLGILSWN